MAVRFHKYCKSRGIHADMRMPYGAMKSFIQNNIVWTTKQAPAGRDIAKWCAAWRQCPSNIEAAVAERTTPLVCIKSLLKSRATKTDSRRQRAPGAGRHFTAPLVRQELYHWWTSIRYAIDWKQLVIDNRSRGLTKNLARFPRSIMLLKLYQMLQDHAHACLLSGVPVASFKPSYWWFQRWEEEYGLSMRQANRKYQAPRHAQKQRMELFWVTLFRIRLFIRSAFGYEPVIYNFDQTPYHHNETGSQNKATLGVRGSTVPVVEGNSDVKSRWTANLTTCSEFTAVAGGSMPWSECVFKGAIDGRLDARLKCYHRSRGFPSWFTVTTGPKGSYRERDVIEFLKKHLEPWRPGRRWHILLADDYTARKSDNVFQLRWSRGYILLVHGGGCTPVAQTPDTDLNEHVRRHYGNKECALTMEKMRQGQAVPKLTHEECMEIVFQVLSDPGLREHASKGYKKVGQSVDLYGGEDGDICREAGKFWNEPTTDRYANVREKINTELAAVAEEFTSGGLTWCQRDVKRLICPYPAHRKIDKILANLGEDFSHDDIHNNLEAEEDDEEPEEIEKELETISDEEDLEDDEEIETAVAAKDIPAVVTVDRVEASNNNTYISPLSAEQADQLHIVRTTIGAIESAIESLKMSGVIRGAQCVEAELSKERRRERDLMHESPAVAETFLRLRRAEAQEFHDKQLLASQMKQRKQEASTAIAARNAAVAELKQTKRKLQELESARACKHAVKTFTLDVLGAGSANAGGAKARKNRFEVLDRLSRHQAGLSDAQKNDFAWWKEAWDEAMVTEHGANWADTFAGWVQAILDGAGLNAFSKFMCDETVRVLQDNKALAVPGG